MSPSVNRRAYHSPVRDEQAQATRRRILESAERLFVEVGYARATIKQIARAAQVSEDLVFHNFGTKRGLLEAAPAITASSSPRLVPKLWKTRSSLTSAARAICLIVARA